MFFFICHLPPLSKNRCNMLYTCKLGGGRYGGRCRFICHRYLLIILNAACAARSVAASATHYTKTNTPSYPSYGTANSCSPSKQRLVIVINIIIHILSGQMCRNTIVT